MTSIIKVDNLQNQCGANIISESANVITIGASGDTVTLAAGASQSGFGRSGSVNWDTTPKTSSPVTAVSGNGYFINTTSGAITVNLPAGSAGAIVALSDYAATWNTNNVTVNANGTEKIGGVASAPAVLNTRGQAVTLVYVDSTRGWINTGDATAVAGNTFVTATGGTITTSGDYKIHTFTGPGTFTVTCAGTPAGSTTVDYLVIAGGGGGGGSSSGPDGAGGGGGGGFRMSNSYSLPAPTTSPLASPAGIPVSVTAYPITVGGGGTGGVDLSSLGTNGVPSVFSTITSAGGGRAGNSSGPVNNNGGPGGSGGGSHQGTAGTGNTPPVSPPQGQNGGGSLSGPSGNGGGGAGAVGTDAGGPPSIFDAGPGGVGSYASPSLAVACAGTTGPVPGVRYFSGGGGGSNSPGRSPAGTPGSGGAGGGGNQGVTGTTNTGGGGGGGPGTSPGSAGGSGIVVIRYKFQ